jgi:signal transduction histidine kinase/ligand-binding sensor domain-containing protein
MCAGEYLGIRVIAVKRPGVLALASLVVLLAAPAPAERLPVQRHGVAEGLAEETVTALLKDSRGYLWIGSLNGLSRYDGERFKVYGFEDGLPKLRIHALAEGRDGSVWVATSGGLVRLDPADSATRPVLRASGAAAASGRPVEFVFVDGAGAVWFASCGDLFRLDGGIAASAGLASTLPGAAIVRAIREGGDGTLWIGTSRGLARRAPSGALARVPLGPDEKPEDVRGLVIDRAARLWVTTSRGLYVRLLAPEGGPYASPLPLLDPQGRLQLPTAPEETRVLSAVPGAPHAQWQKPLETRDGRFVLSTTSGLVVLGGGSISTFGRRHGLGDGILGELLEDAEGNLWIGTQSTGLLRLSPAGFTSFGEADGLADFRIGALVADAKSRVYAVSAGNTSLHLLEPANGLPFPTVRWRRDTALPGRLVWGRSVLLDRSGAWWIATPAGLARYGALPFEALPRAAPKMVYTTRDGLGGNDVSAVFEDAAGAIWAGAYDSEAPLARLVPGAVRFQSFRASDGLPAGAPLAFLEDGGGSLWIGFGAGGPVRHRGGAFERLGPAQGAPEGFVHDFLLDRAGRLWIANGGAGALRVDAPAGPLRAVSLKTTEGPATGSVLCLAEDAAGFLYFGTTRGVDRLDPKTGRFRHFTTADGLANNLVSSALRDGTGALWFGTPEGVSRFVPLPDAPVAAPRAVIAAVRVNGNPRLVPEVGARALPAMELDPDETRLRIDFAAPSFTPSGRVRYQTRLEGVDAGWSVPNADPTVRYVGLAPGRYRFAVRALSPDGTEAGEEASFSFRIRPPFWRRTWFLLAAAAAVALAAVLVHRQGVRRAVALERVRTRLATDLHDDVGSSLAQISILSEVGRRHVDEGGEAARFFDEIGETSRAVIDALGDAIWSIDPRRDDLQSLGDRLRHFATDLLEGRGISCHLELPPQASEIELPPEPRRHLFLLLKEAVTNAARHSRATSLEIAFRVVGRMLDIEVRDNGSGLPAAPPDGNGRETRGLANMAERARALGGRLDVTSRPGGGTRIHLGGLPLPLTRGSARA